MNKAGMKAHMVRLVKVDGIGGPDPMTGEINSTELAECTAHDFGHDEWLDDDAHEVWDAAYEVAQAIEGASNGAL